MALRNRLTTLTAASILALTCATTVGAQDNAPSVRFGQGELVSTNSARSYYASVSNPATTDLPLSLRNVVDPEIKALAAGLDNDPDLIFEYVHDKIAFVPTYGLQKGALGTLIDKAGNAFDQAQLLVELLRAAGHSADYVMGDATISWDEFKSWYGVENAIAACGILADGGIPASIGGANSSCGGLSTNISGDVKVGHVWVTGTAGGTSFTFDPSLKEHDVLPGTLNLTADMGYTSGAMLTTAGGVVSGRTARDLNTGAINNSLDSLSTSLMDEMNDPTNYDRSLDELIGAELVKPLATRQDNGTYAGVDSGYNATTTVAEIPNAYRTLVELDFSIIDQSATDHVQFYGDELYGRRLAFDWKANDTSTANPSLTGGRMTLDDEVVKIITTRTPGGAADAGHKIANGNSTLVKFTVDHAYASNGGTYMDRVYQRGVGGFSQSVTFVFGFGGSSDALQSKLTSEHYRDTHYTQTQTTCDVEPQFVDGMQSTIREIKLIDHIKTQVGYGWLAQFSRAAELQARSVGAEVQHHHSFGMVYTSAEWANICDPSTNPTGAPTIFQMLDNAVQIDMLSGLSINHYDGDESKRKATAHAMAMVGSTLEGSVFEQYAGKAHTASTTERFEWFNANATAGQAFRIVDDTNWQSVNQTLNDNGEALLSGHSWYQRYTNAGYIIVAPQGSDLGPGAFGGAFPNGDSTDFERGSAFIAFHPTTHDVAHIVFTGLDGSKGGGAKQDDDEDGAFDPSKIADVLRDQFEDRSRLHGVDLASGQVSYSPPADLTTGAGEFPYSLAFQRSYSTSGSRARGMGVGWSHNWDINASASGSGTEAMGATRAVRAVPSLVAFTVIQDVLARSTNYAKDDDTLKRMLTASFVSHWWREQLQNNVVTVQQGANGIQFVKLPGEVFDGPTGSNAKLEYVGSARRFLNTIPNDTCATVQPNIDAGRCRLQYDYANVEYRYTSADGDSILFKSGRDALAKNNANVPQFLPEEWTFPAGMQLTFNHNNIGQLTSVQSNLGGRQLTFSWIGEKLDAVTGTGLGSVQFTNADGGNSEGTESGTATPGYVEVTQKNNVVLSEVRDLMGNTTKYTYVGNGLNEAAAPVVPAEGGTPAITAINDWLPRLYEVITPEYTTASQRFTYDTTWRVTAFEDGEAVLGNRHAWAFNIAPGHRGERVAPTVKDEAGNDVNPAYEVNYDIYGNAVQVTDEGGRITTATYDGINRVKERTFPSGTKSQFSYDTKSNVEQFTQIENDGSGSRTVSATYTDTNWVTKPTSVTDAMGRSTTIGYIAPGGTGAGQPARATLPSVSSQPNQYRYLYNEFGQLSVTIDPEQRRTLNVYNDNGFLASATQDSTGLGLTTRFTYDDAGNQLSVNGPRTDVEDITRTTYDALRRPITQTDPIGTESTTIYDKNGRAVRTEVRGDNGSILQVSGQSYTATGQTFQTFSPECYSGTSLNTGRADCAVTLTTYDGIDRSDIVTDPEGRQSQTVYFESGDVARVMRAVGTPLEQAYQTYTYYGQDEAGAGQVKIVADANGNTTEYRYDDYDRLLRINFPSKTTVGASNNSDYENYFYDLNDNQIEKRTRAGDWIENQYDSLNRVIAKFVYQGSLSGPVENTVYYTYDLLGRDLSVAQLGGVTKDGITIPIQIVNYTYDTAGRLTSEGQNGRVVNVGYNAAGARDRLTYPSAPGVNAKTVTFTYDAAGRMDLVKEGSQNLANYAYDDLSRKTSLSYLNNAGSGYTYHVDSAINSIAHGFTSGSTASNVSYTFGYNKANQVTSRNISNIAYVFDGFEPEGSTSYATNGLNQYENTAAAPLLASGEVDPNPAPETVVATSYSYDDNANLTSTGRWDYLYDAENRLVQAHDTVLGKAVRFQYDGKGRRIAQLVDNDLSDGFIASIVHEYLYEGDEPIQDYLKIGTGNDYVINHRYLHGASVDERLVHWQYDQNTGAELKEQFYHRDHQGSIIAMSDASGGRAVGELYTYDAYGNQVSGSLTGQPFRYTGRRYDAETGLYYYRARYYSAELGRFLQTDPIGYEDNMNLYGYVGNDPINNTDPTGKFLAQAIGGLIGGTVNLGAKLIATGGDISLGEAIGSFSGGATTGALVASGVPLTAANAAGAFVESVATQAIDTGSVNVAETLVDTAAGAAIGKIPGARVPGITAGRNNFDAVAKGQVTKLANGSARNTSASTVGKGVVAGLVGGSTRTGTNILVEQSGVKDIVTEPLDDKLTDIGEEVCQCRIDQ